MINSNLKFSAAQRLVKKLCQACSIEAGNGRSRNPHGCRYCKNGISGRVPVMEYLTKDELSNDDKLVPKVTLAQEYLKKHLKV